jgi:hypothetical protein
MQRLRLNIATEILLDLISLLDQILMYARNFEDKIRAYTVAIYAFGSRSEHQKAIDLSLEVLQNLGETFP